MGDLRYRGADDDGAVLHTPNGLRLMPKGEWVAADELGFDAEGAKTLGATDDYEYRAAKGRKASEGDEA